MTAPRIAARPLRCAVALVGLPALGLLALGTGTAAAQTCNPPAVSFGFSQPNNVPVTSDNAVRWATDATLRIAYGGLWCPDDSQVTLEKIETGEGIAAQIRISTPAGLVQNAAAPLTLIDIDPVAELEPRTDYRLVLRPPNPSLPAFAAYTVELRTAGGPAQPLDENAFEGATAVELFGERCGEPSPFAGYNEDNEDCPVFAKMRLAVRYTPLDRADLSYVAYRVSSTPLDEAGNLIAAEADNERVAVGYESGARDVLGTGITERRLPIEVLYFPAPRRDCFSILMLDEWGRERGDASAVSCFDLVPMEPCPEGCQGGSCGPPFPPPDPEQTNPPIVGQSCPNLGLNGADPDRSPDDEPGAGGAGGEGGGGVADAGTGGETGGKGSDGCNALPARPSDSGTPLGALALIFGLLGLRRRRS
jgi:hypothetical protein